jgi:hypothetical protein
MNLTTAQKISVATPGTPVALSSSSTARVRHIHIQAAPANTGKVYLGTPAMVKATLAGVAHVFAIPATGQKFEAIDFQTHEDAIYLNQYAVDADVAAEGLIVSTWTE